MTTKLNPYQKQKGFGLRYLRAKCALEKFGRDYFKRPYCRSFDNCFEMNDGDAIVWALMHAAIRNVAAGDHYLKTGIENMGASVWSDWMKVYEPLAAAATSEQLALDLPASNRPGDEAAAMHEETGIPYERCLVMCNMD